jgi:hypothetical protein
MSSAKFNQINPVLWPSGYGETVAVLSLSSEALASRYGLVFFDGSDNLDAYRAAAVRLESGRRIGLLQHCGAPVAGTELQADTEDEPLEVIREFLDCFGLTADELVWVREEVPLDHLWPAESAPG